MNLRAGRSRVLIRLVLSGQLPLWRRIGRKDRTWRWTRDGRRWKCVGCGDVASTLPRTYCRKCRRRLESGLPVDLDEYLTDSECRGVAYGERTNRVRAKG